MFRVSGFRVSGFSVLGLRVSRFWCFRVSGFRVFGFRVSGFWCFRISGFMVFGFRVLRLWVLGFAAHRGCVRKKHGRRLHQTTGRVLVSASCSISAWLEVDSGTTNKIMWKFREYLKLNMQPFKSIISTGRAQGLHLNIQD